MFKKFTKYFVIFFAVIFVILNSRFVTADVRFWLAKKGVDVGLVLDHTPTPVPKKILPIVEETKPKVFALEIPKLGAKAPIVLESSNDPNVIFNRLEDGVVHYAGTVLPGEPGVSVILGHSSAYPWYKGKYGSVFALLTKLNPGDEVFVSDGSRLLKYRVTQSLLFNPLASKNPELETLGQSNTSSLVLVSCWPVGTAYKRIAVKAELVK